VTIWVDAQLSPALAAWINGAFPELEAHSVRSLGMRDASDLDIFFAAREAGAVMMSKDADFLNLLDRHGPPPPLIWITAGNTSNQRMREILDAALPAAVALIRHKEAIVEISDRY
jgi:predicted nuclease of predicted toxin-antitoxin system